MPTTERRLVYWIILFLGLMWIFLSTDKSHASTSGTVAAPQQNFLAPDIELNTTSGETVKLSDLCEQAAVLVNLWATWCPPCREEMKSIDTIYKEYKDKGLVVLGVNMTYQDDSSKIAPFIAEQGLIFPILLDQTGAIGRAYQLYSLPSSFFIGRDGIIHEVVIGGPMAEALLRTRVEDILK